MLNITYGKMSDRPVSYFSTENVNFLIFSQTGAESMSLPFLSVGVQWRVLIELKPTQLRRAGDSRMFIKK